MKPFELPFTAFHNYVLDRIMPNLSGSGWKVLCVAIRQTLGWQDESTESGRKESDRISYSQFQVKTGIKSPTTVARAIQENLKRGYLLREPSANHIQGYDYRLNQDYETIPENGVVASPTTPENGVVVSKTTPENGVVVSKTTPENGDTKESLKERGSKENISADTDFSFLTPIGRGEADSDTGKPVADPLKFDLARRTEAARAKTPNYADPLENVLIDTAISLFCNKRVPQKSSGTYRDMANVIGKVHTDFGLNDEGRKKALGIVKRAIELFMAEKPSMTIYKYPSFEANYYQYLSRAANGETAQKGVRHGAYRHNIAKGAVRRRVATEEEARAILGDDYRT